MKRRVLIVEDEAIVAEDLQERLEKNGYEILAIVDSGKAAISLTRDNPPDVLLMDVHIKGELDGIETAISIQSYFEEPIPVVFLTGFKEESYPYLKVLDQYIYINKPYIEKVLLDSIERALQQRGSP